MTIAQEIGTCRQICRQNSKFWQFWGYSPTLLHQWSWNLARWANPRSVTRAEFHFNRYRALVLWPPKSSKFGIFFYIFAIRCECLAQFCWNLAHWLVMASISHM